MFPDFHDFLIVKIFVQTKNWSHHSTGLCEHIRIDTNECPMLRVYPTIFPNPYRMPTIHTNTVFVVHHVGHTVHITKRCTRALILIAWHRVQCFSIESVPFKFVCQSVVYFEEQSINVGLIEEKYKINIHKVPATIETRK